jgi:putative colanic acid biosysnthesis UDP-glucose lipid carrier transferase
MLGRLNELPDHVRLRGIDTIFITIPISNFRRTKELFTGLRDTTASVYYVPDIFVMDLIQSRTDQIRGIPIVALCESPFYGWRGLAKRASDLVLAGAMLTAAAPLMLLIAIGVRVTTPGSVIFPQVRYGLGGDRIVIYKFRTMTVSEDGERVVQARKDDSRITPFGAFLRRYSLDELPQLINVLQGRMSVVGPRPHAVAHNEEYRKVIDGYMLRHKVTPGITGLAQISGYRGETRNVEEMQKRIHYDLRYLREWSLMLDLKILLRTATLVLHDDKAY